MTGWLASAPAPELAPDPAAVWAIEVVTASPLPVLVLETADDRILAASEPAIALLSAKGRRQVVGGTLAGVSYRIPAQEVERPTRPDAPGFLATRFIHVDGQLAALELWIRPVDPTRPAGPAFAVIAESEDAMPGTDPGAAPQPESLLGSTDRRLLIDRVGSNVPEFLGATPDQVLGTSLLDLAAPADVSALLDLLTRATRHGFGGVARLALQGPDGGTVSTLMAVIPLLPSPSCGFVAVRSDDQSPPIRGIEMDRALRRLAGSTGIASASGDRDLVAMGEFPGRSLLSARELEVVRQLYSGNRVPAIARGLYLSQSTVRNYLSSVFRKLGVGSQQELLDLLRQPAESSRAS